jgi:solute:Na+ symporter, SSS family
MNFGITMGFVLATLIIGILKRGKTPDIVNYYVSGRSKSAFAVSGSIVATAIGGSATIGLAGIAYSKGAPAVWWLFSGSIALVVLGIFWAGKVREYEVYTLPEVLEKQYKSSLIKIISSLVIVIAWTGIIAAQIIAAGKIMNTILPGHYQFFIILCAIVFISYTVFGGQHSVINTDIFQSFLIFIGIIAAVVSAYVKHGPLTGELLPAGHLNFPFNQKLGYTEVLMFFMFVGTSYLAGPDMYSRIFAAKDKKSARRSVFLAAFFIAILAILIVTIGLYSKMIAPGIEPESSFQFLIMSTTPAGLQGVVFTALLAAFLSSAATCLLTSGIIITNDILNPALFNGKLDDKPKLFITRYTIIIYGIGSLIIALYVSEIIKSLLLALTVYTTGIVLPVVLGFYREKLKLNKWGASAGILAGGIASIIIKYLMMDQFLIYIFPAVLLIIFTISWITND